ncbi:MAG: hypothetical protein UX81_C0018G0022 [Parcubacteria group bacterium GW2011_GWA2_47_12]|nr:MAG: hypothetical protein UX81_C0018G0022 [Parcubacteria group bacterium GW2011_GWA2_47_12]
MTAKTMVSPLLVVLNSLIEFIFKPFVRRYRSTPPPQAPETFPVFENDARETVREIAERESVPQETDTSVGPEIVPKRLAVPPSARLVVSTW